MRQAVARISAVVCITLVATSACAFAGAEIGYGYYPYLEPPSTYRGAHHLWVAHAIRPRWIILELAYRSARGTPAWERPPGPRCSGFFLGGTFTYAQPPGILCGTLRDARAQLDMATVDVSIRKERVFPAILFFGRIAWGFRTGFGILYVVRERVSGNIVLGNGANYPLYAEIRGLWYIHALRIGFDLRFRASESVDLLAMIVLDMYWKVDPRIIPVSSHTPDVLGLPFIGLAIHFRFPDSGGVK